MYTHLLVPILQVRVRHKWATRRGGQGDCAFRGHPLPVMDNSSWLCFVAVLGVDFRFFAFTQGLDDLDGVGWGKILVVVVRVLLDTSRVVGNSKHGRVDACAHALHLTQREHAILGGLSNVNAQRLFQGLLQVLCTLQPAWGCTTQLNVVLAHFRPVEHAVKRGNLINSDWRHVQQLGHTVHGWQAQETMVLLLGQVQQGDHR
mmetsp:Transcript_27195/g.73514  ORF Transcript_27195/g.73514 Transcript_27195/m.73514 type:complete len:203 (+) Transcript_27195:98-706(+)